jgi:hypothetical protein
MTREAQMRRVIALLEEALQMAEGRGSEVAELIERARRAALERLYPGAGRFISVRERRVKAS